VVLRKMSVSPATNLACTVARVDGDAAPENDYARRYACVAVPDFSGPRAPATIARSAHAAARDVEVKEARISCAAGAFLLLVLLTSGGGAGDLGAAADHGACAESAALAVSVSETREAVLLHIQASGDVEPGSVEVRFAHRKTVVLARDAEGRSIRSQLVRLPEPVVEEGSSADYDADGALVMTLRKQATAQDAEPTGDPRAAAR
jgi:hypothetical protein